MYRITYEQGNGYQCGCCRRTSRHTEDLKTPEEVQEWVNELAACQEISLREDDDDRDIESIEKEFGVNIQNEFLPQEEVVEKLVAERKKLKEKRERKKEKKQAKNLEERDRLEYQRLKSKYEN